MEYVMITFKGLTDLCSIKWFSKSFINFPVGSDTKPSGFMLPKCVYTDPCYYRNP